MTTVLRNMLKEGKTVAAPGVFDGMSARLVANAGFPALSVPGSTLARSCGIPDLQLMSQSEIVWRLESIVDVAGIPLIADADNGYGNSLNAQRAARAFERAGVAAFFIEDQTFPKRSGHKEGKGIIPVQEMVGKLKAVRDALHDQDFVVIGRTDSLSVEGLEAAIERCSRYREAGADVVYMDFPSTEAQMVELVRRVPGWHMSLSIHGSKMPFLSVSQLAKLGFHIVLLPTDLQRVVIRSMQTALQAMANAGSSISISEQMAAFDERDVIVGTYDYLARAARYDAGG